MYADEQETDRQVHVPPVTLELTTWARLDPAPAWGVLTCRFGYSSADPFALAMTLVVAPGRSVTWYVARELLRSGLRHRSGEGDVSVRPDITGPGGPSVRIRLRRGATEATFVVDLLVLRAWLDRTYLAVPAGCEGQLIDWDAVVRRLRLPPAR
jgi:hypothetical protein